jgi:glycosyltransferase involved in cell wall biosynthesis
MDNTIAILLSTYNSEKHLCEQIDSILNQSCKAWTLYIRDDGSTDGTLNIIKKYYSQHSNILLCESKNKNMGAKNSFFWLLEHVDAPYYMFCDHDDVWLPEKIQLTFSKMKNIEAVNEGKSIIVHTDLVVVNEKLEVINTSFWQYSKINPKYLKTFNFSASYNPITGCAMMLNQQAKKLSFPVSNFALMHDCWIGLCVLNSGGIVYFVNSQSILYRQHAKNLVGAKRIGGIDYFLSKFRSISTMWKTNVLKLKMIQDIRHYSIMKYWYFKIVYLLLR